MTSSTWTAGAILLASIAATGAHAQEWRILPANPVGGEPFVIQYKGFTGGTPAFVRSATVESDGQSITYAVSAGDGGFAVPGVYRVSTVVPGLAAGDYQVRLRLRNDYGGEATRIAGSLTVAAAPAPALPALRNLSGNWFNPDEAGWGINIVQGDSGALFGVWLTYDPAFGANEFANNDSMWLVMSDGRWLSPTEFRGLLYSTSGPSVSGPFDRSQVAVSPAGYASLNFLNATEAVFRAEAGVGVYPYFSKEKTVRRFAF